MSSITLILKVITFTIAITFVLIHLQNESKTHLHGVLKVYFQTTYDMDQYNKRT